MNTFDESQALAERFKAIKNRARFAKDFSVPGGDAMIYQHIKGLKPISLAAARAYARGFGCSVADISPRQAREIALASDCLLPLPDTHNDSTGAESPRSKKGETAMFYAFSAAPRTGDAWVIPQYAAGGSMGTGLLLPDQPGVIEQWSVSKEWLAKNVRAHSGAQNLCIVTGFGPSMQPMYNPGDPLLVDKGVTSVIADGVYFFRVGEEAFIKQLQKIPTEAGLKYVARSKNRDYSDFEITAGMDFEILGRVVRVWCGTDY